MWVRFKHRFASHEDRKWSHIEIPDDWKDHGYGPEVGESYIWSDKYRGFKYEVIDNPPSDFIMKRVGLKQHINF